MKGGWIRKQNVGCHFGDGKLLCLVSFVGICYYKIENLQLMTLVKMAAI